MKETLKIFLKIWLPIIIVLTISLIVASNPLRYSESFIKSRLLSSVPLGTSMEKVEQYIAREGWEVAWISVNHGFFDQRLSPKRVIGSKSIRVSMGNYQDIPFEANVTVFWGFDDKSKLIDIWVWKTWDGL